MKIPSFKKTMLFIHRWLGLISGLVVLILSITGCLFVFHQEISKWTRGDVLYVDSPGEASPLPVKTLQQKAKMALDLDHLTYGLTTYRDPTRSWTAMSYIHQTGSWTYFGSMADYRTVYINPYTGEIKGIVNEKKDFFQLVKGIHWSLLLATPIGQPIVVWSTVVFIVLLITGMILWWPRRWSRSGRQRCFKIKWGSTWRRVNYDLHNVLGFYFLLLALIIAATGLYWYFPVFQKTLHFMGTGSFQLPEKPEKVISTSFDSKQSSGESPLQIAYQKAWSRFPTANSITFTTPIDKQGAITASIRPDGQVYYNRSDLFFDRHSGALLDERLYAEKNVGEKILAMNYDIHVGAIGGIPGKIIAFLVSLVCASLPATGFIIWWNRRKRSSKRIKYTNNVNMKKSKPLASSTRYRKNRPKITKPGDQTGLR